MSSEPVFRTIREQIADRIRTDVLSGRLGEGSNLREERLARQYGVSRAPVRDALLQLTQEGLLEDKPHCGVRVGSTPNNDLQPILVQLRRKIESFALDLAFDSFTKADFKEMDSLVQGLRDACKAQDMAQVVHFDMAMHQFILEKAGSSELVAIWLPIVSRMMLHYSRHNDMMESHRDHAEIVDAIRAGDRASSFEALLNNIQ